MRVLFGAAILVLGCSTANGSGELTPVNDASVDTSVATDVGIDTTADVPPRTPDPSCVVPDVAGPGIALSPTEPTSSDEVTARVSDSTGYTNVAFRACTPDGLRTGSFLAVSGTGPYEWSWKLAPLPAGESQLQFAADPANKVWSTRRLTVPASAGDAAVDATVGPTPTLCAAPSGNLIAHGTFEEGMDGLAPTGWQVRNPARPGECSGTPASHVFITDSAPTCGGKALAIDSSGGAWDCYAVQTVSDYKSIRAGRTYRISATVRSRGNAPDGGYCPECTAAWFTLGAQWVDAGDAFFGDVKNPKVTETDYDWKVLSFDVVAPSGAERILVWLSAHYPGRVDYDNVSVVEVP